MTSLSVMPFPSFSFSQEHLRLSNPYAPLPLSSSTINALPQPPSLRNGSGAGRPCPTDLQRSVHNLPSKEPRSRPSHRALLRNSDNIQAPSSHGLKGATVGDSVAWIRTQEGCPAAFVPRNYCYLQFLEMCVGGDKKGYGMKWYGASGGEKCQLWFLNMKVRHDMQCKNHEC